VLPVAHYFHDRLMAITKRPTADLAKQPSSTPAPEPSTTSASSLPTGCSWAPDAGLTGKKRFRPSIQPPSSSSLRSPS